MPIWASDGDVYENEAQFMFRDATPTFAKQRPIIKDDQKRLDLGTDILFPGDPERSKKFIEALGQTWPAEMVKNFIGLVSTAKRAWSGEDVSVDEMIEASTKFGLDWMGGGLATAGLKPGAGVFGGRFPSHLKERAEIMERLGHDIATIKKETGLERGAEGKWRFEFSDRDAIIRLENLKKPPDNKLPAVRGFGRLKDVLDHPKLYEMYPEIKDLNVIDMNLRGRALGKMYWRGDLLALDLKALREQKESPLLTILHEIQHWIQLKEGWEISTPDHFSKKLWDKIKGKYLRGEPDVKEVDYLLEEGKEEEARELAKWLLHKADYETYWHQASEQEALNTMRRFDMPEVLRRNTPAMETETVPRWQQLVRGKDYFPESEKKSPARGFFVKE